jgi:hypothetical protein
MRYLIAGTCFVSAMAYSAVFMLLPDQPVPLWDFPLLAAIGLNMLAAAWLVGRPT